MRSQRVDAVLALLASWRLAQIAEKVLRQRYGGDRGGLGSENPRSEAHGRKTAGCGLQQLTFAPPAFGRHAEAESIDISQFRRSLGETFSAAFGKDQTRVLSRQSAKLVERRRLTDLDQLSSPALFQSFERDSPPTLQPLPRPLFGAPFDAFDVAILRDERRDSRHAEFGRFLNHPIELVAFDQSLRQRQSQRRFYDVVEPPQQVQIDLAFGDARDLAFVFDAFAVEYEYPRARAQPQNPSQMMRLVGVEPDGRLGETQ